jgi:hypothetical protein
MVSTVISAVIAIVVAVVVAPSSVAVGGGKTVLQGKSTASEVHAGIRRDERVVAPRATEFTTLQLNLCNSGFADCYAGGQSVPEANQIIWDMAPSLVTVNEVCKSDVTTSLFDRMLLRWPNEYVFWAFMPAGDRRTGGAYQCANGDQYGIGMLGRLFTTSTPYLNAEGLLYSNEIQDPTSNELRAWLCVDANRMYWGCTTHLKQGGGQLALDQCNFLTKGVVVLMHAVHGYRPTVVAGDLNLRYQPGNQFNVQQCVPGGWFRKGDGDVQHTMATGDFTFAGTEAWPMMHSDHPAWVVFLDKP